MGDWAGDSRLSLAKEPEEQLTSPRPLRGRAFGKNGIAKRWSGFQFWRGACSNMEAPLIRWRPTPLEVRSVLKIPQYRSTSINR